MEVSVRRDNGSEHGHERNEPERRWRKHRARLDLARMYLTMIAAGLSCAVSFAELIRAVFNH